MKNIIGVRYKKGGKIYFFDPGKLKIEKNTYVIVETDGGEEFGEAVIVNRFIPEKKLETPLKPIHLISTKFDMRHQEENKRKEK